MIGPFLRENMVGVQYPKTMEKLVGLRLVRDRGYSIEHALWLGELTSIGCKVREELLKT